MKVTRRHPFTGDYNTIELPITNADYLAWANASDDSSMRFTQVAFPDLTADQREFLITGLPPGEFDALFPDTEDDNDE